MGRDIDRLAVGIATQSTRQVQPVAGADGTDILSCQGLRRAFGKLVAVDGVSFTIRAGETYGLLGPNGAGKTTTILVVAGILPPDAGTVLVDGLPMTTQAIDAKRHIGYVPQEVALCRWSSSPFGERQ